MSDKRKTLTPEEVAAAEQAAAEKAAAAKAATKKDPFRELASEFAKSYPGNKIFHITTDMQVFLSGDLSAAQNHQRSLSEGEVKSINIE